MKPEKIIRSLTLLVLLVLATSVYADKTVTFGYDDADVSIAKLDSRKTTSVTSTDGKITLTVNGGSGENVSQSDKGDMLKFQRTTSLTITGNSAIITRVRIVQNESNREFTPSTGTISKNDNSNSADYIWSGEVNNLNLANDNSNNINVYSIEVTYRDASSSVKLSFEPNEERVSLLSELSNLPVKLEGATRIDDCVSSDPTVAKVYRDRDDDTHFTVRYVGVGTTVITATSGEASASYTLHVEADEATYTINRETFTVTGPGILESPIVQVPGLKMTIGNGTNAAIVKRYQDNTDEFGTLAIDENGFAHVWMVSDTPYEGTFYKFEPYMTGPITITGYVRSEAGRLILKDATTGTNTTYDVNSGFNTLELSVVKDHTYYLYEDDSYRNSSGNRTFSTLMLTSFTFAPTFKLLYNYAITDNSSATEYGITDFISGAKTVEPITPRCKGDVTSANVTVSAGSSEGNWNLNISGITFKDNSNPGGAIVIPINTDNGNDVFVFTIPYKTHEWDFTNRSADAMKSNTNDWFLTYQVRQYTDTKNNDGTTSRTLTYLNNPVLSNATAINGTNANYIDESAGLLISANARAWGSRAHFPANSDMSLGDSLAVPYTAVDNVNQMTIYNGTTITIPNLKKGQYIRIQWSRHSEGSGDTMSSTNVTDLIDTSINTTFHVGQLVHHSNDTYTGYEEFKVNNDGLVTFTLSDNGWTDIRSIKVDDDFIDTDMRLHNRPANLIITTHGKQKEQVDFSGNFGDHQTTSSLNTKFYITEKSDSIDASVTDNGILNISGFGTFTLEQRGITDGYVLDREITRFTVFNEGDVSQIYPHTWDFTNIDPNTTPVNLAADAAGTHPIWHKVDDNTYGLIVSNTNFHQGGNLNANSTSLGEYDGLGFRTNENTTQYDNNIVKVTTDGRGLIFSHNDDTQPSTLIIPNIQAGYYAYIRCHQENDDNSHFEVTSGQTVETIHQGTAGAADSDGDWIYRIAGDGKNINISISDYTIYKIGVTNTFKDFNAYNGSAYATEYRAHNEKYDLSSYFTYGAMPVTAYIISRAGIQDRHNWNVATTRQVSVAPSYTGVILQCTAADKANYRQVPLFVRDINTDNDIISNVDHNDETNNLLSGVLTDSVIGTTSTARLNDDNVTCTNYVFTKTYYLLDDNGNIVPGSQSNTGYLGFYRIAGNDNTRLGANKAFLQIPQNTTSGAKLFFVLSSLFEDPTGIDRPRITPTTADNTYYTLSGQRIEGRPSQKGIYIVNGKKVFVK